MSAHFRRLAIVCSVIAALAFVPIPLLGELLVIGLIVAGIGQAWNWIGGYAGETALGSALFFGIGAYGVALSNLRHGLPWFAALGGGIAAVVIALIVGFILLSFPRPVFAIATAAIGIGLPFAAVALAARGIPTTFSIPVERGFLHLQFDANWPYVLLALVIFAFSQTMSIGLEGLRVGYYLRALRDDAGAAAALGINRRKWALLPFAMSAFVTAIAGALFAQYTLTVTPELFLWPIVSLGIVFAAVVGGRGTVWGPPIGALAYAIVSRILSGTVGLATPTAFAIVLVLALVACVALPKGLIAIARPRPA